MNVTAAVINQTNAPYQLEELQLSPLQPDEVKVKVIASGICHSDEAVRVGDGPYTFPAVLGHEGAGIVEEVGSAVKDVKPGDHVVMSYAWCGHCPQCRHGHPSLCHDWIPLNEGGFRPDGSAIFSKKDGTPVANFFSQSSFATHTLTKFHNLIVLDKKMDLRLAAPLGCGLLTGAGTVFNGLKPAAGSTIAIFGTGAVGLGAMMAAKIAGCRTIVAVDIHDSRLELARSLGATHTINSKQQDALAVIKSLTSDDGVSASIDTTGQSAVMKTALDVLAIGGTLAPVAVTRHDISFNTMRDLVASSRRMIGVLMGDAVPQTSIPQLIDYHQRGLFPIEKLVKFYDFSDINQASQDSASGATIKPVLILDKSYRP